MEKLSAKRFVRALRGAMEDLAVSAKSFCYSHEKEYQEVQEDLKFSVCCLEDGEEFAGKLLYKNARKLAPSTAQKLAEKAKTDEERQFYLFLANRQYPFERDLAKGEVSVKVIDARRFGVAIRKAMELLRREAGCYRMTEEPYYKDVQAYLEQLAARLVDNPKEE